MKTIRKIMLTTVAATAMFGLIFLFTRCTKTNTVTDHVTNTVTVTQPASIYSISGLVTYPTYSGATANATGAVLQLYVNSLMSNPTATATANDSGKYYFSGLLPGTYIIGARYNTVNQNTKTPINGTNFDANYSITVSSSSLVQNIALETETADTGKVNISINPGDTLPSQAASGVQFVKIADHDNVSFYFQLSDSLPQGLTMNGIFESNQTPAFEVQAFRFDQSNPANDHFHAYVLNRLINTGDPTRDTGFYLYTADCENLFWSRDTEMVGTWAKLCEQDDTAYYWANAGQVSAYGSGYIAKGTLAPCWKASGTVPFPGKVTMPRPDTNMGYNGQLGWDQRIQEPVDMYFEYQGAKKVISGANFTWEFEFEAQMVFYHNNFYMEAGISNACTVNVTLEVDGIKNQNYFMLPKKAIAPLKKGSSLQSKGIGTTSNMKQTSNMQLKK